jgi:hypothetical protein
MNELMYIIYKIKPLLSINRSVFPKKSARGGRVLLHLGPRDVMMVKKTRPARRGAKRKKERAR